MKFPTADGGSGNRGGQLHPDEESGEMLGVLRDRNPKPAGFDGISKKVDAFLDMVALTEELGLYDDQR